MKRNTRDHPEGEPESWGDQPKWPPDEPDEQELDGDTPEEQLQSGLAFLEGLPALRGRIRAFLIGEGLPELYAEVVAEDVSEGWANGDPAPIYTMPGFVPPQDDPAAVAGSRMLRAAVEAWRAKGNPPMADAGRFVQIMGDLHDDMGGGRDGVWIRLADAFARLRRPRSYTKADFEADLSATQLERPVPLDSRGRALMLHAASLMNGKRDFRIQDPMGGRLVVSFSMERPSR